MKLKIAPTRHEVFLREDEIIVSKADLTGRITYVNRAIELHKTSDCEEARAVKADHMNCRMGKWYLDAGKAVFGKTRAYSSLDSPHSILHSSVHRALELSQRDWVADAAVRVELVRQLEAAENASSEVMRLVSEMVVEKTQLSVRV